MALATQVDVEAALGRPLTAAEGLRVESLLTRASALVIGFTGQDFEPAPYPATVTAVVADMAGRVFTNAASALSDVEQQAAGPFSVKFSTGSTSSSLWLTAADKMMLRPYRLGGGLSSVQLVGDRYDITGTV